MTPAAGKTWRGPPFRRRSPRDHRPAVRLANHGDRAVPRDGSAVAGTAGAATRNAPVVVLSYPYSGAERWWSLLAPHPELACTLGTGLLPLCEQAAASWRLTDGKANGPLSPLAVASIRALATSIIPMGTGEPRVRAVHRCLPRQYRRCLTAYWIARTQPLLDLEDTHPDSYLRVRYEDLDADPRAADLFTFLGLDNPDHGTPRPAAAAWPGTDTAPAAPCPRSPFPAGQVPLPLLAHVNDLTKKLGYPPLSSDSE